MTATNGRIEALAIVVPTGGWDFDVDDGTFSGTLTVAAGTYSPTTLLAAFVAALNASASALVFTGTCANGEGGTGKVTVASGGSTHFEITWGDTDLRDALGFSGANTPDQATQTGDYGMAGLWLPDCPRGETYVSGDLHWEGGPTQTVSPTGVTYTVGRPGRIKAGPFAWSHVSRARARQYSETGGVRSFERLMRDVFFDQCGYIRVGSSLRYYFDADAGTPYVDFYPRAPETTESKRSTEQWTGLYSCSIEGWET